MKFPNKNLKIAIIGLGPRGLSILERLCSNHDTEQSKREIEINIIDPFPFGSGKTWNTKQSKCLLMNTVASQISLFTDTTVKCDGPIKEGPSLYEWSQSMVLFEDDINYKKEIIDEAKKINPNTYPTRAFYGHYLKWVLKYIIKNVSKNVKIRFFQTRAISLNDEKNEKQIISLENGIHLSVDKVILALGHGEVYLNSKEKENEKFAKNNNLVYIPPSNPSDVELDLISSKHSVLLKGLGLNFFDYMALFTIDRGGKFVREHGKLRYIKSGNEPKLFAGSRRGIPYHARGENEKGIAIRHNPLYLTEEAINNFQIKSMKNEKIDFLKEIWPLIAKEVETVYYKLIIKETLGDGKSKEFVDLYKNLAWKSPEELDTLRYFGVKDNYIWDWEKIAYPYKDMTFRNTEQYNEWLISYLKLDLEEAKKGNMSGPLKAALDVLRDLRNEVRLIVNFGKLSGKSYEEHLDKWYTPLNAFLSIGPPASRIEELIALLEEKVLNIIGPNLQVLNSEKNKFSCYSNIFPEEVVNVDVLIEARLPIINVRESTDPLQQYLLKTGQCKVYSIKNSDGTEYVTGGIEVSEPPNRLVDVNGVPHPHCYIFGVPTEGVHWVTAAGIRPGVNSFTLIESDAIARECLGILKQENISSEIVLVSE